MRIPGATSVKLEREFIMPLLGFELVFLRRKVWKHT
jgi:hypothetical protein